jgi:hypothetical protein
VGPGGRHVEHAADGDGEVAVAANLPGAAITYDIVDLPPESSISQRDTRAYRVGRLTFRRFADRAANRCVNSLCVSRRLVNLAGASVGGRGQHAVNRRTADAERGRNRGRWFAVGVHPPS